MTTSNSDQFNVASNYYDDFQPHNAVQLLIIMGYYKGQHVDPDDYFYYETRQYKLAKQFISIQKKFYKMIEKFMSDGHAALGFGWHTIEKEMTRADPKIIHTIHDCLNDKAKATVQKKIVKFQLNCYKLFTIDPNKTPRELASDLFNLIFEGMETTWARPRGPRRSIPEYFAYDDFSLVQHATDLYCLLNDHYKQINKSNYERHLRETVKRDAERENSEPLTLDVDINNLKQPYRR